MEAFDHYLLCTPRGLRPWWKEGSSGRRLKRRRAQPVTIPEKAGPSELKAARRIKADSSTTTSPL